MTLTAALRAYLLADSAIALALNGRFGPPPLDREAGFPAATRHIVSGRRPDPDLAGTPPGEVTTRIQIDVWSPTEADAQRVAGLLRQRLAPCKGVIGGAGGIAVSLTQLAGDQTRYESALQLYRCFFDALITHGD